MGERNAWSVFIWYGGLLLDLAAALGDTKITTIFADKMAALTGGMSWAWALTFLLLIYFYTHYFFASITAHVLAMLIPFLAATNSAWAGAPVGLAVLALAYFSNLNASLTHYGTTPAPIYFGTGYVKPGELSPSGFIVSIINIAIWSTVGVGWWKLLGWWY